MIPKDTFQELRNRIDLLESCVEHNEWINAEHTSQSIIALLGRDVIPECIAVQEVLYLKEV